MKKDWILLFATISITLIFALSGIRWLAPSLLGIPVDLQMVQTNKTLPPFFEGIFRKEDYDSNKFILKDPYTSVRSRPLFPEVAGLGPHDILGFRNRQVPNVTDIVVIGDSQTYGINVILEENWPSQLEKYLTSKSGTVYAMAVGGWGAVQYLDMFFNAAALQPRIAVIAFYTGNDAIESFLMAYNSKRWKSLRLDAGLDSDDAPRTKFPAPKDEWWSVQFKDGINTVFTPKLRMVSNMDHPAVKTGYGIMAKVAEVIEIGAKDTNIKPVFTIIPTKELVYWPRIKRERIQANMDYLNLVKAEQKYISQLRERILQLKDSYYVDVITPLQEAAMESISLYLEDTNGHPLDTGYAVIGKTIAKAIEPLLPTPSDGLYSLRINQDLYNVYLIRNGRAWLFPTIESLRANGWQLDHIPDIGYRDLIGLPRGIVDSIDPAQFGPETLSTAY